MKQYNINNKIIERVRGEKYEKRNIEKALALALTGAVLVGAFAGCGAKKDSGDKKKQRRSLLEQVHLHMLIS